MQEIFPIVPSSFEQYLTDLPKVQKRIGFLLDKIILRGTPVIVSDFIISYSTISSLTFDIGGFYFVDEEGVECKLRSSDKAKIQYLIEILQRELLMGLSKTANSYWIPHYRVYIEPDSGQPQLLLDFRMRELGQVVDGTRETVSNFV